MLKYVDTDIVFQEIPDEVTLAVNLSGCPCRCPGCHSKHLWGDTGEPLTDEAIDCLLSRQPAGISCVALMGGDASPAEVDAIASRLKQRHPGIKTAWYSGRSLLSKDVNLDNLDYVKLGPYLAHLGPLKSPKTNQRLYLVQHRRATEPGNAPQQNCNTLHDLTPRFWRNKTP